MVFSVLVPYVPVFAMFFFMFKYYVDKYNLSFNYKTQDSGGIIKQRVVPLTIFNIIIYQVINIGFFVAKAEVDTGARYLSVGLSVVGAELLFLFVYNVVTRFRTREAHKNLRAR